MNEGDISSSYYCWEGLVVVEFQPQEELKSPDSVPILYLTGCLTWSQLITLYESVCCSFIYLLVLFILKFLLQYSYFTMLC